MLRARLHIIHLILPIRLMTLNDARVNVIKKPT